MSASTKVNIRRHTAVTVHDTDKCYFVIPFSWVDGDIYIEIIVNAVSIVWLNFRKE